MSQSRKPLRLAALRLVGFHNFHDQFIPIRGDLFAVGSNESGKTTILDALHLALAGDQQVDLNAAASMVATREPARKMQGIILRADMTGKPRKKSGITYVAVELAEVDSTRPPHTLVMGMSVADMNSRVRRWATICRSPAAELPLTQTAGEGQRRVVDDRELERQLGQPIWRRMTEYRDAVAELLLDDTDQFGMILDLWRKAKSYRELSRTSRDTTSVIRQVLPPPDHQAFENVAKSLADVAEWEVQLDALRRDVEALSQLEDKLRMARDAREACRRYAYVEAWHHVDQTQTQVRAVEGKLKEQCHKHGELSSQLLACREEIAGNDKSLRELQASQGMRVVERIRIIQGQLAESTRRLGDHQDQLNALKQQVKQLEKQDEANHKIFASTLSSAETALVKVHDTLAKPMPRLAQVAHVLHETLPSSVDVDCHAEALHGLVKQFSAQAEACLEQLRQRRQELKQTSDKLNQQLEQLEQVIRRIERHEDLVPELPGLDAALTELNRRGIAYQLLYQSLEFTDGVSEEAFAAIEAALGIERLSTIIVPPDKVSEAKAIVNQQNTHLRLLETEEAPSIAPRFSLSANRLMDQLFIDDGRVKAHLAAVMHETALLEDEPQDGSSLTWRTPDGRAGEPGARWRGQILAGPWIGAEHRRRQRQTRLTELQSQQQALHDELAKAQAEDEQARQTTQHISQARETVAGLNLPWPIEVPCKEQASIGKQLANLQPNVQRANKMYGDEQREHDRLSEQLNQAKRQADKVDAHTLLKQVDQLKHDAGQLSLRKDNLIASRATAEKTAKDLEQELVGIQSQLEPARQTLAEAADMLLAVLDGVDRDNLHQHTFIEKRASQIKLHNLRGLIDDAGRKEAAASQTLKGSDGVMNALLAQRYGFRLDDQDGRLDILDPRDRTLASLLDQRQRESTQAFEALGPRTQDLFQRVLGTELIGQLQINLTELRRKQREFNTVLESLVFGHSRFKLHHTLVGDFKPFVTLVESASLTNTAARDELVHYIRERKHTFDTEGNVPSFLDYRNWFDFNLQLQHVSNQETGVVGSEDMVRGSGGAQGTHIYLLLFAMAKLLFNRSGCRLRLLMLDEAFYGVDPQRKELLLRCGKQLKLDFAIATPDLDGTIMEDGGDSTTVLVEKDADDEVDVIPFVWEHHQPQQALFAAPRPEAIIPGQEEDEPA